MIVTGQGMWGTKTGNVWQFIFPGIFIKSSIGKNINTAAQH